MEEQNDLKDNVLKALETIRPYLKSDGGDIEFVEITDEGVVKVKFLGACDACPMSFQTLKAGVEQAVKKIAPSITSVEEV